LEPTLLLLANLDGTNPLVLTRAIAIVQSAVFDAVNGIEPRYTAVHVQPAAPAGASRRAAAVQAAYATMVKLFPTQQFTLDLRRTISLQVLSSDARETSASITSGINWGQKVADEILAWRSTDGSDQVLPPFLGGEAVGMWRPTPPDFIPGIFQHFATVTPWSINSPSQFQPQGPPALASRRYAADFNEVKTMGSATSATRTPDQTIYSLFWGWTTASYLWNNLAVSLIERPSRKGEGYRQNGFTGETGTRRHTGLLESARILAAMNIAMADAGIACWDGKYTFAFWRPITAIPLADSDGNPETSADPTWTPLLPIPPHPEYPSAHSCFSGAAAAVLSNLLGENTRFSMTSDSLLGVKRSFGSFSAAMEEVKNARIFAGIHFRSACDDGQKIGIDVANHVLQNSLQPINQNPGQ
jgi:hypothetical protein